MLCLGLSGCRSGVLDDAVAVDVDAGCVFGLGCWGVGSGVLGRGVGEALPGVMVLDVAGGDVSGRAGGGYVPDAARGVVGVGVGRCCRDGSLRSG